MKAVIQNVTKGAVSVNGRTISEIGRGLVILLAVKKGDTSKDAKYLAEKIANLRIFPDKEGKMNNSLLDVKGEALVVSQFTLYGSCRRGRRPSFDESEDPKLAEPLYLEFVELLKQKGIETKTGVFRVMMMVEIHNDGPVTFILES